MSELVVGSIAGLAANSYVVDVASGSTLDITNATGTVPSGVLPTGSVLQVVSTTKVDTFTTTSSSFVDITGLSATITPSSTNSKIMVFVTVHAVSTASEVPSIRLLRGATAIGGGTASGNRYSALSSFYVNGTYGTGPLVGQYLDSPATTSATTYKVQGLIRASGTLYINTTTDDINSTTIARTASTITVMEVAG